MWENGFRLSLNDVMGKGLLYNPVQLQLVTTFQKFHHTTDYVKDSEGIIYFGLFRMHEYISAASVLYQAKVLL